MHIHNHFHRLLLSLLLMLPAGLILAETDINSNDELSSEQLVTSVLQANPQLEIARAAWQASAARIEQRSALNDAQFSYGFAPMTIGSNDTHFGQRLELSQQLPWPDKLRLQGKKAEYEAENQQQTLASLQLSLATTAKTFFADWYFIHRAIAINRSNQQLLHEFRDIALTRYRTGQVSQQDVLHAEMESTLLKHRAITLERERKTLQSRINTLLNLPPEKSLPLPGKLTEIKALPDLDHLQMTALQNRPELKAANSRLDAVKTGAELAELAYYPDFKVSAGYNSLWDNEDKRFNIGVSVNLPLDQDKLKAAVQEARAKAMQAHWRKVDIQATIREDLQIAYDRVLESQHVLQLYRQHISDLADADLAAAKADYQSGQGDFLTLISSEKNRMQTQLQTEQALAELHRRLAELEHAVGQVHAFGAGQYR